MIGNGKSKGRHSRTIASSTTDAQEFALYALGKEKLKLTEGILEAVTSVKMSAKVQVQG